MSIWNQSQPATPINLAEFEDFYRDWGAEYVLANIADFQAEVRCPNGRRMPHPMLDGASDEH